MKRNVISLFKFCSLAIFTVFLTVLIFRYVRGPRNVLPSPQMQAFLQRKIDKSHDLLLNPSLESYGTATSQQQIDDGKIDWHDYDKIAKESKRVGIGEQGRPASLPPSMESRKEQLYSVNGFNAALSDLIPLNRSIPDIRHPACKKKKYLKHLDSISVIVSFHNEHFTTLLRTCYSVINRSPESLLTEIILVDDASTKEELKKQLDDYIAKHLPKVKIVRLKKRSGLIRGRLAGAKIAKAKILVFLDSHSEANVNWLPPLLEPIVKDYKTCVCPFIDVIKFETFEYRAQDEGARGAFDWELYYKRLPLLPEDLKHPAEPFKSPVMAGGLFAISAKFFWELGGYDTGLDIWGGEQYELSFKIWQCGGQMFDAPCSRVGHIYRKFPPFPNPGRGDFLGKNYKRVAEVWMDEYAEYVYLRRPHYRSIDPGDLVDQKAIRNKLQCKPFKWFMEKVAFDLVKVYPPIEPQDYASGAIWNVGVPALCLDAKHKKKNEQVVADYCIKDDKTKKITGEQEFKLTWHKDLRIKGRSDCLDVSRGDDKAPVMIYPCHGNQGNQLWRYDVEKQWLIHGITSRCLDLNPSKKSVFLVVCDPYSVTQKWLIKKLNIKAINNWQNIEPKV